MIKFSANPLQTDLDTLKLISQRPYTQQDIAAIHSLIDQAASHAELTKSFWSKLGKIPVKKEVTRKDGTSFLETFYTAVKKMFHSSDEPAPLYPGSFKTIDEAESVFGRPYESGALSDWYDQIRMNHKEAIRQYSGFWYSNINEMERGNMLKQDVTPAIYNQTRQYSKLLEEALGKYELKQDIVVHRQVSESMLSQFQRSFQSSGKLFIEDGFFSTTAIKGSVNRRNSIDLVVKVPKGTGRGAYIKYLSDHPFENEFLINSHSVFTVDDVKKLINEAFLAHNLSVQGK